MVQNVCMSDYYVTHVTIAPTVKLFKLCSGFMLSLLEFKIVPLCLFDLNKQLSDFRLSLF